MAKCEAVKKGYICLYESQSHLPNVIKQKVNNKVQKVCHKETMKFEWVWNRLLIQRYITQTDPDELIVLLYFACFFFLSPVIPLWTPVCEFMKQLSQ